MLFFLRIFSYEFVWFFSFTGLMRNLFFLWTSNGNKFFTIFIDKVDLLGINYLGTHTMRKTWAYRVYTQSNYNIGLVMHLLNHSSEAMTLAYLGLDQASTENMLNQIDFGYIGLILLSPTATSNTGFWGVSTT